MGSARVGFFFTEDLRLGNVATGERTERTKVAGVINLPLVRPFSSDVINNTNALFSVDCVTSVIAVGIPQSR